MKNGVKAALIISALAGGFAGAKINELVMRPKIIQEGAGHFDQISGEFTWGKPEMLASNYVNQKAADLRSKSSIDAALSNALKGN